jgi:phosphopantetheinyl transferase
MLREAARRLSRASGATYSSRSYRFPYALVAWDETPLGIDLERIESFDLGFVRSISTPSELAAETPGDPDYAASLWSSKEALAKALGDAVDYDPRRLDSPMFWPGGRSGRWRALALPVPAGYVGWMCWRAAVPHPEVV